MTENFALLRDEHEGEFDLHSAAKILANIFEFAPADTLQLLAQRPAILMEDLPETRAVQCEVALQHAGIAISALPMEKLVDLPPLVLLRGCQMEKDALKFEGMKSSGSVKWSEVLWINLAEIQAVSSEEFDDWELGGGEEPRVIRTKGKRTVTNWEPHFDIVSYDPWLLLRVPLQNFRFAATGLNVHSNRKQNLFAVSIAVASKSKRARLGPGMKWFEAGSTLQEYRASNDAIYENVMRWELTRLFLNSDEFDVE